MSDANREVLDFMREQFARLHTKMDRIIDMNQDEAIDIVTRLHTAAIALDAARALAEQVAGQYDRTEIHNLFIGCCEQMERIAREHGLPVPMLGATEA